MTAMASKITSLTIVYSTAQRASNAKNVSIWWRHHDRQIADDIFVNICSFYLIVYGLANGLVFGFYSIDAAKIACCHDVILMSFQQEAISL